MLTLRRAPPDNPRDERYAVMVGETYVGAIVLAPGARDAPMWTWSISAVPRLREATTSGRADSREDAMADFRAAWDRAGVDLGAWRSHMAEVELARKAWERRGKVLDTWSIMRHIDHVARAMTPATKETTDDHSPRTLRPN